MDDESRKVKGLGDTKEDAGITKGVPSDLKGMISGKTDASGFFEKLARGSDAPEEGSNTWVAEGGRPPETEQPADTNEPAAAIPEPDKPVSIDNNSQEVEVSVNDGNCPHCGKGYNDTPSPEPSKEEMRNFVRYVFGKEEFTKDYEFMGGNVIVTLRARSTTESDAVVSILRTMVADNILPEMPIAMNESYIYNMQRLLASVCLKSVRLKDEDAVEYDKIDCSSGELTATVNNIKKRHKEISENTTEALMAMILHAQRDFDSLVSTLTSRAGNPDFFQPIAG